MYDFSAAPPHMVTSLDDIVAILDADIPVHENKAIRHFVTDNRNVRPGDVFVAIKGARVDGHRFVDSAFEAGATAALVSHLEGIRNTENCILTPDPVAALGYLAAAHRRALPTRIIGLTGSVGKTTTKDILHAILNTTWQVRKSEGNLNSTIGLPTQLLQLTPKDEWMVAEMGMSYPGEIETLTKMADPDIGMLISVHAVHLANFENIDGIADAKAELVHNMAPGRTLVYNLDNELVASRCKHYNGKKVAYAMSHPAADYKACIEPFSDWEGCWFELTRVDGRVMNLCLPLTGRFNVGNALAACAAALEAGFPASQLNNALRAVTAPDGRCSLHQFYENVDIVDDTYNSNPHAVQNVLRSFAALPDVYYRWLILGDMLELGDQEIEMHRDLGREIAGYGFDRVSLVGPLSKHMVEPLQQSGVRVEHFETSDQAASELDLDVPDGVRIWVKASRGIRLEKVSQRLIDYYEAKDQACSTNS